MFSTILLVIHLQVKTSEAPHSKIGNRCLAVWQKQEALLSLVNVPLCEALRRCMDFVISVALPMGSYS